MNKFCLVAFAAMIGLSSCQSGSETQTKKLNEPVARLFNASLKPFYHGVASGDPLSDRVIIWTRVTPEDSVTKVDVKWEVAEDTAFNNIVRQDTTSARAGKDYTVKVDVNGLKPATTYYYRFNALGASSIVGRTKTLPVETIDSVRLAVVSCSNWEFGYFNAYARIAERELDAIVHLGDYIYEYAQGGYGNEKSGRTNLPPHEIITLADYRTRYSQYHLDDGLRKARQQHPLIAIWDDHELANDSYTEGAQNHQAEEGDFEKRKAAARQAYYEWIPIREEENHYRSFMFGSLASLIMLDERLEGRVKPLERSDDPALSREYRTMLGREQMSWLKSELKRPETSWKIIGNQVMFTTLKSPDRSPNMDSWAGYPLEKDSLSSFITANAIPNTVFVTGDTHASWAFEVSQDPFAKKSKPFAVELGTTSISSSNANEYKPDDSVKMQEQQYLKLNPHLKYSNLRDHGYLLLTVTPSTTTAEWFYVETLLAPDAHEFSGAKFNVAAGTSTLDKR